MFNFKAILLIIVAIVNIFLAWIVYFRNKKSQINIFFSIFAFAVGLWALVLGFYHLSISLNTDELLMRSSYGAAVVIGASFYYMSLVFPLKKKKYRFTGIILLLVSLFLLFLVFIPGFLVQSIVAKNWGNDVMLNSFGYYIFSLFFTLTFLGGMIIFWKKYFTSSGIVAKQIFYIVSSGSIAGILGMLFNLILPSPLFHNFQYIWIGPIFTIIWSSSIAYAIMRHRLLDIRLFVVRSILYTLTVVAVGMIFIFVVFFLGQNILGSTFRGIILGSVVISLGLEPLIHFFRRVTDRYFFQEKYNYQKIFRELTESMTRIMDLQNLLDTTTATIKNALKVEKIAIVLWNNGKDLPAEIKQVNLNILFDIYFSKKKPLIKYLSDSKMELVSAELKIEIERGKLRMPMAQAESIVREMQNLDIAVCLPIISNNILIGVLALGDKQSGDVFSIDDIQLLNVFTYQAAIALENALLYKQVQDFSKTLQGKVDEQTKDIRTKSGEIEEKNKYLQELLEMKSDFLRTVNHQLNTPLSVMKGYFSMMEEGSYPADKAMPSIKAGLERISSTVADFWDAYELEGERMKMQPQKTDITEIVSRLIPEKQKMQLARERNLTIEVLEPKFKMPIVWCDYKKIAHVVSNLLDNAVYYTRQGKVTLYYELLDDNYLQVNVKDTGVGISEEDKKKLFQKFSRGNNATDLRPDGSGLGLFIAKKIVEGNWGELAGISQGQDKGATFSFTLPIYKNQQPDASQEKPVSRKKIVRFKKV
ncbi:MAG: GAF domain-containing protein [Parcubacteria group bacterium]|nr:GAF domain-containing protein [Parcubacteria group bacterium]